jgi:transcriptional regulator with XRE-family HTH domain
MTKRPVAIPTEEIRRVRRQLDETQAEFAKRLGVDPVTVARWETGQRACSGIYALAVARLDPEGRLEGPPLPNAAPAAASKEDPRFAALAHLVRAFFGGSTAKAVSALVAREALSSEDLDTLAALIDRKKKQTGRKR